MRHNLHLSKTSVGLIIFTLVLAEDQNFDVEIASAYTFRDEIVFFFGLESKNLQVESKRFSHQSLQRSRKIFPRRKHSFRNHYISLFLDFHPRPDPHRLNTSVACQ